MRATLAVFLVVLGLAGMAWALFLAMDWPGLLLLGGAMLVAAGLLGIQIEGSDR